jgi:hypothetical protein
MSSDQSKPKKRENNLYLYCNLQSFEISASGTAAIAAVLVIAFS